MGKGANGNESGRGRGEIGVLMRRKMRRNVLDIQTENVDGIIIDTGRIRPIERGKMTSQGVLEDVLVRTMSILDIGGDIVHDPLRDMMLIGGNVLVEQTTMKLVTGALLENIHVPHTVHGLDHPTLLDPAENEDDVLHLRVALLLITIEKEKRVQLNETVSLRPQNPTYAKPNCVQN
jgi:hypothetical protein